MLDAMSSSARPDNREVHPKPLRVLVTGSRDFSDMDRVLAALRQVARENPGCHLVVVHGDARGADKIAATIAAAHPEHLTGEAHPAQWRTSDGAMDRGAGPRRNQLMVDLGADLCLAFYLAGAQNKGTRDCVRRAQAAGITVREIWSNGDVHGHGAPHH